MSLFNLSSRVDIISGNIGVLIHNLHILNRKADKIMATQAEEAAKLNAFADKLDKATAEIVAAVQALKDALASAGGTSPEVDAATGRLDKASQTLDDLNADPVVTPPAV